MGHPAGGLFPSHTQEHEPRRARRYTKENVLGTFFLVLDCCIHIGFEVDAVSPQEVGRWTQVAWVLGRAKCALLRMTNPNTTAELEPR